MRDGRLETQYLEVCINGRGLSETLQVQEVYTRRKKLGGLWEMGIPRVLVCVKDALLAFPFFLKTTRVNFTPRRCW